MASSRRAFSSLLTAVFGGFPDRDGELDFSTFLTIMHAQIKQEDPKKEILLAMLMADKEKKGYIMASELRSKLMKLGEKLTHKEGKGLRPLSQQWGRSRELGAGGGEEGQQRPIPAGGTVQTPYVVLAPRRLQLDVMLGKLEPEGGRE